MHRTGSQKQKGIMLTEHKIKIHKKEELENTTYQNERKGEADEQEEEEEEHEVQGEEEKEQENGENDNDNKNNEKCDDNTILPFCEVKIQYGNDEAAIVDEGEELVHLNDDMVEDDVHGDYSCQKCKIHFATWNMLKRHTISDHEAIDCYKCRMCLKVYDKLLAFESHVVNEHGTGVDRADEFLVKMTLYRVSRGTSSYTRVKRKCNARRSMMTCIGNEETKNELLSCSKCEYKVSDKRKLARHVGKHVDDERYACKTCGGQFRIRRDLRYHVRFAHRDKTAICDYCGKTCRTVQALQSHRKFVHLRDKFECHLCCRVLVSQKNLEAHMTNVHVNKKPPKIQKENKICHACGKAFRRRDHLRSHMSVHTGERPHVCSICKEAFAKRDSLRQHLLLHTGAKPYVCDICGKAFAQKPGLSGHRRSHPGPHPPLPPVFIGPILEDVLRQCYEQ